jgi:hypothetical protein
MKVSNYEGAATALLRIYPIGTYIRIDELFDFAEQHADGLAADNVIDSVAKKFGSLRRHLNDGGASRNFPEPERFVLEVTDTRNKTLLVRSLTDHAVKLAATAVDRSAIAGVKPLKAAKQKIDDVKIEDLSDQRREEIELIRKYAAEDLEQHVRSSTALVTNHYANMMLTSGLASTKEHAVRLIANAGEFTRADKTLKAIS